ncbi:MAG: hypothetical protein U0835_17595 [Isosphaeraceae bacterium]
MADPASNRRVGRAAGFWAAVLLGAGGVFGVLAVFRPAAAAQGWVWVEGEAPYRSTVKRHPFWYDKVKRAELSGGDFLSHWDEKTAGEALYRVNGPKAGTYELWVRANPVQSKLSYKVNDAPWTAVDLTREQSGNTNIAEDGKADLRFIAWAHAGSVRLNQGVNYVRFRFESENNHHGALDCFVLSSEPFAPSGTSRPDQLAVARRNGGEASSNTGWFAFSPAPDRFRPGNDLDLRGLNERQAGDGGFIAVRGGAFVHSKTGEPVRFWAVNGPPGKDAAVLRREARTLAKRGVNLVRVHHSFYDNRGKTDPAAFRQAAEVVSAMKAEGIYTHFSIYFPVWLALGAGYPWLDGYDGNRNPFAALMFNPDFQKHYREWWRGLLLTPDPSSGRRLVDDPAVAGVEIQNEDSFFFWTFDARNVPDPQLRLLERQFGDWLAARYGSVDNALKLWGGPSVDRDNPREGRVGFRPLFNLATEKTARDQATALFLVETQRGFYKSTYDYLRSLGFKGVITASNWATASPEVLGPLEKYSYTTTDFLDRHGYFGCLLQGDNSAWSVREGQTYADRSALRFEPEEPGKPRVFAHPAMDPSYDGKPSMISETTFNRPNRFRSEAPLYYAVYGALQGSDAVVHFALDTTQWTVKPNFFMQPWTLMSPAMMGQFPAAALIYRKGLIAEGDVLADVTLATPDLFALKGTPLPQDAALDELRLKDVPQGPAALKPGAVIDPLVHYAGRTAVHFAEKGSRTVLKDLSPFIDRARQTVTSTHGQVHLDYGKGLLTLNAPAAQGASGALNAQGTLELKDIAIRSNLDLGHVVAVSLDGLPLATSRKILLQVMTEEKTMGFQTEPAGPGRKKILNIGRDPWLVRKAEGTVRFKRADASSLKVTALDPNGDPVKELGPAAEVALEPMTIYYLIH